MPTQNPWVGMGMGTQCRALLMGLLDNGGFLSDGLGALVLMPPPNPKSS